MAKTDRFSAANPPQPSTGAMRRRVALGLPALLALGATPAARAQAGWPNKPIRMLVGYTPGGFTDNMARAVGEPLARVLGQPVLFDYKPGANSIIAVDMTAKSAPDGYTLTTVIAAHSANPSLYAKLPFDHANDLVPVALTGVAPLILVANKDFPPNTPAELIAYVKARPGQFNFGSSGIGAAAHLAMEQFMAQHGLKMQLIPYKGTQPALTDLIGGQIQLLFDVPLAMVQHAKAGKIKVIGMSSEKRLPAYPEVPTFAEGGAPFIANTWSMILAPAKTPKEIVTRLNAEVQKILASPAVREKLESTGVLPGSGNADEALAFLNSEVARNARVIRQAGIKLEI
ncbi:MAG: tripartite tricarboxylate transporter substrate binding protein [Burkholderiales bacterium]|nr:tripartite tricarboxylate transporter substrate binding protein [Burkholderiales bacterium]